MNEVESHVYRAELILEHLPRVRWIASRIHRRLPKTVALEDLISIGVLGLIEAVDRFDPNTGVKLNTYAEYRIRGAILDSIRELDGVPAHKRARAREFDRAAEAVEQRLNRVATSEDVAAQLGISITEYHETAQQLRSVNVNSLASLIDNGEGLLMLADTIADHDQKQAYEVMEEAELKRLLRNGIEALPPLDRRIMTLYFLEGQSLREIAALVGLHISRISQIKARATDRLRRFVQVQWSIKKGDAVA